MRQAEVIKGCLKNDRKSQYELYRMCYERFMVVCERYQSDKMEAESALNTSFLKILSNLDKYSHQFPLEAWCRKIIINTNIDIYRSKKRSDFIISTPDYHQFSENSDSLRYDHHEFEAEELFAMISKLPDGQSKVFNLFAIDGYGHKEISHMLDISEGTSKWYLHKARKSLKDLIESIRLKKNNPAYGK
ncbi:MAG: sigma-70 family RNA polymerase sigma factor [Saprospiraceae bacterium]|nr:sigma-70 family RNA polymerase sigma factor [Saprospiraceae bacterium]